MFKDLARIEKNEAKKIVSKLEEGLIEGADNYPLLKGQFKGLKKMRIGDYRCIYTIINAEVVILRIAHRKEVYKY